MNLLLPARPRTSCPSWGANGSIFPHVRVSDAALTQVVAGMRADPATAFHTEAAAAHQRVPSFAFIRAFKRLTGISPQRFHAALRIERAKQLLVDTTRPVTDISLDVGYNSLGTFVRTFTLLVGLSPTQLRRFARGEYIELAIFNVPSAHFKQTLPGLRATILNPPADRLLAAGLFPQGLPAGLPIDGCLIDPAYPCFELRWYAGRENANLLAASVSLGSLQDAWAGRFGTINVCSQKVSAAEADLARPIQMDLRPLAVTDPPFLTPVPLLMFLQSKRSSTTA